MRVHKPIQLAPRLEFVDSSFVEPQSVEILAVDDFEKLVVDFDSHKLMLALELGVVVVVDDIASFADAAAHIVGTAARPLIGLVDK